MGVWARSVPEIGGDAREEHHEAIDRTGPNHALYLTASSVRSYLALGTFPFFRSTPEKRRMPKLKTSRG
jgi:hypothetical protein